MAHTWRARDRASRALNLDLSKLSQDFRFYFDSVSAESFTTISVYGRNKSNKTNIIEDPFDMFHSKTLLKACLLS